MTEHLFFDLDHTLWDYPRASRETLTELHQIFGLDVDLQKFILIFEQVNASLWHKYNHGLIDREFLRTYRFAMVFDELGVEFGRCEQLNQFYVDICCTKPYLIAYAVDILKLLKSHFTLHIITNGFVATQTAKLHASGIAHFFTTVTTSEDSGYRKPNPAIFRFALEKAGAVPENSAMIGDNYSADIVGAMAAGLRPVYFNPAGLECPEKIVDQIRCLSEIPKLFLHK